MANPALKRNAFAKPSKGARIRTKGPTAKLRAAKARKDAKYAAKIRALVAERDGGCRYGKDTGDRSDCWGTAEWAHLGDKKRFKTRGLPPEERHTTASSVMLCSNHHDLYDHSCLLITGNADEQLTYEWPAMRAAHASGRRG